MRDFEQCIDDFFIYDLYLDFTFENQTSLFGEPNTFYLDNMLFNTNRNYQSCVWSRRDISNYFKMSQKEGEFVSIDTMEYLKQQLKARGYHLRIIPESNEHLFDLKGVSEARLRQEFRFLSEFGNKQFNEKNHFIKQIEDIHI